MDNKTLTPLPDPSTIIPPPPSPPVVENPAPFTPPPSSTRRFNFKILGVIVGIILVILIGLGSTAVAVAYEKISLNNPDLERKVSYYVQGLPFMPKTPRFVLEAAAVSHTKVSKHKFDVSLAAKSDDFTSELGVNQIDVEAKGSVDYSDPLNLKLDMNVSITKDFNLDLRKKDTMIYLKINKVPDLLYSMLQVDKNKVGSVFENWIGVDTKPLDTEARRNLDKQTSEQKSVTNEYVTNMVDDLLDENLLPKLKVNSEKMDDFSTYKLSLVADSKTVDDLITKIQNRLRGSETKDLNADLRTSKPSDYIKDLVIDIWVDDKDYYVRKIVTSFKYNPNYQSDVEPTSVLGLQKSIEGDILGLESGLYSLGSAESSIVTAVKFENFGQDFEVSRPSSFLTFEEFYAKLAEASGLYDNNPSSSGANATELSARSRDATRLADLANLNQAISVVFQESISFGVGDFCRVSKKYPCFGSSITGTTATDGSGWVKINLSTQRNVSLPRLPKDPTNNTSYHYAYCANNDSWELNAVLESNQLASKMTTDGGDDPNKYEIGSDLTLIDKVAGCKY